MITCRTYPAGCGILSVTYCDIYKSATRVFFSNAFGCLIERNLRTKVNLVSLFEGSITYKKGQSNAIELIEPDWIWLSSIIEPIGNLKFFLLLKTVWFCQLISKPLKKEDNLVFSEKIGLSVVGSRTRNCILLTPSPGETKRDRERWDTRHYKWTLL